MLNQKVRVVEKLHLFFLGRFLDNFGGKCLLHIEPAVGFCRDRGARLALRLLKVRGQLSHLLAFRVGRLAAFRAGAGAFRVGFGSSVLGKLGLNIFLLLPQTFKFYSLLGSKRRSTRALNIFEELHHVGNLHPDRIRLHWLNGGGVGG